MTSNETDSDGDGQPETKAGISAHPDRNVRGNFDLDDWLADGETDIAVSASVNSIPQQVLGSLGYRHAVGLLGLAGFAVLPLLTSPRTTVPVIGLMYLMLFAMSWDIVSGYTGQISLGHAFFFAIGGYTTAALNVYLGLSPVLTIAAGMAMATLGGLFLGLPALRIRGPFLALVTLIAPFLLLRTFVYYSSLFGGTDGFTPLPDPLVGMSDSAVVVVGSFEAVIIWNYYLTFGVFVAVLALLLAVTRTNMGNIFTAIRENTSATESCGINVAKFKLFSFLLSSAIGGLAGAMFVHSIVGSPHPAELLNLGLSLNVIVFSVLGGIGTIVGPIVGVLVFSAIQIALEQFDVSIPLIDRTLEDLQPVPVFIITIFVIFYMREGVLRRSIRLSEDTDLPGRADAVVARARRTVVDANRERTGPAGQTSSRVGLLKRVHIVKWSQGIVSHMSLGERKSIEEQHLLVPAGRYAKIIGGITAGLVAGLFLGAIFASEGLLGQIAVIYGFRNTASNVAWIAHLFHSILFGLIFAAILSVSTVERAIARVADSLSGGIGSRLPDAVRTRLPSSTAVSILFAGMVYGAILWVVVFGGAFYELLSTRAGFGFMTRIGGLMTLPTLILHVIYGTILGGVYALVSRRVL